MGVVATWVGVVAPPWHPGRPSLAPLLSECGQTLFSVYEVYTGMLCRMVNGILPQQQGFVLHQGRDVCDQSRPYVLRRR